MTSGTKDEAWDVWRRRKGRFRKMIVSPDLQVACECSLHGLGGNLYSERCTGARVNEEMHTLQKINWEVRGFLPHRLSGYGPNRLTTSPLLPFSLERRRTTDHTLTLNLEFSTPTASPPSSTLIARLDDPHFPPEIVLEVFSYADRSTLAALCSTSLAFLELAVPFLYETAHFDHLPKPTTSRTPRIGELFPRLALSSVRTLHLTLPNRPTDIVLPRTDLPKLDHILIHHSQRRRIQRPPWESLNEFLPHIDPLVVTFSSAFASDACAYNEVALSASVWSSWTASWTRLEQVFVRGGSLSGSDKREKSSPHWSTLPTFSGGFGRRNGLVRFIYDLRTIDVSSLIWMVWSCRLLRDGVFDLSLAPYQPILI
jgi:hypothetical protein